MKDKIASVFLIGLGAISILVMSCEKPKCPPSPSSDHGVITTWGVGTVPISGTLLEVDFPESPNVGFISGLNGLLIKTTDGGTTFQQLTSGTTNALYALDMLTSSVGYAGGDNGTVLKTTDGGATWTPQTIATTNHFRKLYFIDESVGYVGGGNGSLFKTINGGQTWTAINLGTTSTVYGIFFINPNLGYVCGQNGYLAKTTDGGSSWTPLNSGVSNANGSLLQNVQFIDGNTGYYVGVLLVNSGTVVLDTYIYKTIDGGQTWTRQTYPYTDQTIHGLELLDNKTGYVTGGSISNNSGFILKTDDGQNWVPVDTLSNRLLGLSILNKSYGFAVGTNTTFVKGF